MSASSNSRSLLIGIVKKILLDWKSDFGSKTLGHGTLTCGELRYSPDDQRIFGSAYDASRIWIYNNQYFKGDECISYIPSLAKQTYSHNVLAYQGRPPGSAGEAATV